MEIGTILYFRIANSVQVIYAHTLSSLLRQLDRVTVSVEPARWFRIAAIIRFKPGENS
jgi:hypothetical protein